MRRFSLFLEKFGFITMSLCGRLILINFLAQREQHLPQGMQRTGGGMDAVKLPYLVFSRVAECFARAMRRSA